jgi:hypothetical protein
MIGSEEWLLISGASKLQDDPKKKLGVLRNQLLQSSHSLMNVKNELN